MNVDITKVITEATFEKVVLLTFILVFIGLIGALNKKDKGNIQLVKALELLVIKQEEFTRNMNELVVSVMQHKVSDNAFKVEVKDDIKEIKDDIKTLSKDVAIINERTNNCVGGNNEKALN